MRLFWPALLRKADYRHLQGSLWGVTHTLITLVPHHTGQPIGKSYMFLPPSLSSLTDKLVSVCTGLVQISVCGCMSAVEVGGGGSCVHLCLLH